ncbi:MAG TPA: family 20 glycosylhydrolase [Candidatus Acidoferrales bacterium]|nr:family 20 glycosylhydrolase [Candidatus Acidoferrales bacterium]
MRWHFAVICPIIFFSISVSDAQTMVNVVPKPDSVTMEIGSFSLSRSTGVAFSDSLDSLGSYLLQQLKEFTYLDLSRVRSKDRNVISIKIDSNFAGSDLESYQLDVSSNKIVLKSSSEVGLFRGIQTLLQLIPLPSSRSTKSYRIACCRIEDHPRFGWRGLNLDCVRHFMTKDFIKRYIDLLAYYKFNVFHWHLTDDQGWRIEIKKYPRLTRIGAWRKEPDGAIYGGYYTQDDIKEIVAYAKSRFITVVPEIEMPGHCEASLASYPENACVAGPFEVGIRWGVYEDIYCPGKESTFTFLEDVLKEVMDLFPSHYIHIGGDEVPKNEWKENDSCQELMKHEVLKNEDELQSYFIRKIQNFLESNGREIIGWDEILEGNGPDSGAVVESWRGVDGAIMATNEGLETIVSPGDYTYLSQGPEGLSLDSVYSFDPIPGALNPGERKLVLGTEASMWTERAPQETVDSKMFPRLLAISEDGWTLPANKDLADFHKRLKIQYDRLAFIGVDYGLEKKAITFQTRFDKRMNRFFVTLKRAQKNIRIRYTIGDTLTLSNSKIYNSPVKIKGSSTFIAQAEMKESLVGNPEILSFIVDKALSSAVTVKQTCAPQYSAGGMNSLVDGVRGTMNFRDGLWQGYQGVDIDATIDLGMVKSISEIGAGFYQDSGSWIFMPDTVEYYVSKDGKNFEKIGIVKNSITQKDPDPIKTDFALKFEERNARYFRIVARNIGVCPPWHPGAGGKAWLFIDEIFAD